MTIMVTIPKAEKFCSLLSPFVNGFFVRHLRFALPEQKNTTFVWCKCNELSAYFADAPRREGSFVRKYEFVPAVSIGR